MEGYIRFDRFIGLETSIEKLLTLHERQKAASSCLSESAEVATRQSSPRSSIIMPTFGLFIGS